MRKLQLSDLTRIVIGVDPAVSSSEESDETGIIVAGKDDKGDGYVLEDLSGRYAPLEWASRAVNAYRRYHADRVIGEVNNGGDLIESTIRMVDPNVPFTAVRASRGKIVRAEPVAALYEQGRIHHVGAFPILEDQMCAFTTDFDRNSAGYSPDRVDALVWAITELLVESEPYGGLMEFIRQDMARMNGTGPAPPRVSSPKGADKTDDTGAPRPAAVQIIFTTPSAMFQVASGRRYQASEVGEIEVEDEEDRADLLRAKCSVTPLK